MKLVTTQGNTSNEQTEEKKGYLIFKVDLLQDESIKGIYVKRLNDRLSTDIEGTAEDIFNHLKQNVSEVAAEILGT